LSGALVLVSGAMRGPATRLLSKNGRTFVTATIKVRDGEAISWWKILAFDEGVQEALLARGEGESLAVQGSFKVEIWAPETREPRLNLTVFADAILPVKRPRTPKAKKLAPAQADDRRAPPTAPAFDDDLPF
jgi:hypothetical protein